MKLQATIFTFSLLKRLIPVLAVAAAMPASISAARFEKAFNDSTLRLDYIVGGDARQASIMLHGMSKQDGWAGRRVNLSRVPYTGYGQVIVADAETGDTIYAHSFSTLFSEWQMTEEASGAAHAFQNSFLVPLPKKEAIITTSLLNSRHEPSAVITHRFSPDDILIAKKTAPAHPYKYIHKGNDPEKAIDVVFLAEGYTADETEKFYDHAAQAVEAMFRHEPFASRTGDFNFIAVASPSVDSGVSVPKDNEWRSTAFGSHYSTFYSDRYLTTPNVFDVHDALVGVPYEHIIILANSPVYGGGGVYNSYTLTTTGNSNFAPVVVHEFGHSFGGLADEYFYETDVMNDTYPTDVEPWEPNITTLKEFDVKWPALLAKGTPVPTPADKMDKYPLGVFEGAAYSFKGVYRATDDCRMRTNECPEFCPVCREALSHLIDFYVKEN